MAAVPIAPRSADDVAVQIWVMVLSTWAVLAVLSGVVLGRCIRLADERTPRAGRPLTTADLPDDFRPAATRTP